MSDIDRVMSYWIGEAADDAMIAASKSKRWFMSSPAADDAIRRQFGELLLAAEQGQLTAWKGSVHGCLALIILLDQFSRNLYRGQARAFANDAAALAISRQVVDAEQHKSLKPVEQVFLYMPFEHAESSAFQKQSVKLFHVLRSEADPKWHSQIQSFLEHATEHQKIINRFGRFPHRNAALGRPNTKEELTFLKKAKTFGQ
ncbi:DUF924 domain-containing protein [Pseudomonadales bacterium]|nr:DUF924 domain-containing protein [Pseudomonadales bacterium]MDA8880188.1 DUF924 domain-containing protein [Pseudomonadales bacterium]MDC1017427.1 DUF924 domain-containing protein [Pseudomonadales bacterium]